MMLIPFNSHHITLPRLIQLSGVSGTPPKWFNNHLENRKQFVSLINFPIVINNTAYRLPQGSMLAPSLYLMYIDDKITFVNKVDLVSLKVMTVLDSPYCHDHLITHGTDEHDPLLI